MNALLSFLGYERELLTALPQLQTLNSKDRQGRRALTSDMVNDVPGRSLTVWGFAGLVFSHGSPVSAISHSLVHRLTPIALSLTPGHAWHSSVAFGTSGNWAFFVITCACRSWSILWQFQSHAVAKPGFLTAWMLVCLLVQSLLF